MEDLVTAAVRTAGARLVREVLAGIADTTQIVVEHRVAELAGQLDRVVVLDPGGGIRADGPPARVFAEHGDALSETWSYLWTA